MNARTIERLAKLNELRSSGALTEAEFEAEKHKLLSGSTSRWPIFAVIAAAAILAAVIAGAWILPNTTPLGTSPPRLPTAQSSAVAPPPVVVATRTPAERLSQAFEAATGHSRIFRQTVKSEEFTVTPIKILELPFGPALLVKREIKDGCHACTGFLAVYYLREDQGQTVVTASFPEAVTGWGWGAAPSDWQITNQFTANPAIYASGGYTGQGITESSASITELRPSGPVTSDLIGTAFSDAGAISDDNPRPGCEVAGKIAHVAKDRSFDVVVSGSVTGIDHYVKQGPKFVAVNKRDWGVPCPS